MLVALPLENELTIKAPFKMPSIMAVRRALVAREGLQNKNCPVDSFYRKLKLLLICDPQKADKRKCYS